MPEEKKEDDHGFNRAERRLAGAMTWAMRDYGYRMTYGDEPYVMQVVRQSDGKKFTVVITEDMGTGL